jgi:signal transduction histidine kinase
MDLNRREILVIEDNPDDHLLVRRALQAQGTPVVKHAETLQQALTLCTEHLPDAVLLDLHLPDSHGLDTFRLLHAAHPALPIVVLTGLDDESLGERAITAGAQDWFRKDDLHPRLLLRVLNHAIQRQALLLALTASESRAQASEALAKANETRARNERMAMESMLAIVAHDLRAPLQGIRASIASLLDHGELASTGLPLCEAIGKEADHLIDLATNLIDVDRIANGRMPWQWGGADPTQVVREVATALTPWAAISGSRLSVGAASAPLIHGDGSACRRLVTNLVGNAIRHARATNILMSCTGDGSAAEFVVMDDGRGIDPANKDRLGRPFASTDEAARGGVGLGLVISLGIAAAHGGHIAIRSRLGKGTQVKAVLRDLEHPRPPHGAEQFQELDLA